MGCMIILVPFVLIFQAVERKAKPKKALVIPRSLQQRLPFKDKPKVAKEVKDKVQSERIAVMREPRERKVRAFFI